MAFVSLKTRCWRLWKRLNTKVPNTFCITAASWICHSLWSLSRRSAYRRTQSHRPLLRSLTLPMLTLSMQEKPRKLLPLTRKEKCFTHKKANIWALDVSAVLPSLVLWWTLFPPLLIHTSFPFSPTWIFSYTIPKSVRNRQCTAVLHAF